MTLPLVIRLSVFCDDLEQDAWRAAAATLEDCLGSNSELIVTFVAQPGDLAGCGADFVAASLLPEVWPVGVQADEPLAVTCARWQKICHDLQADAAPPAFLCTVFRHVTADAPRMNHGQSARERIRRLNLLAAELSQETGILVIDIDRALAHAGGRAIGGDARLGAPASIRLAADTIVGVLLAYGLDHIVPDDRLAAAANTFTTRPVAVPEHELHVPAWVMQLERSGQGTRAQTFARRQEGPTARSFSELLRDIRWRRIGLLEAMPLLLGKVKRYLLRARVSSRLGDRA